MTELERSHAELRAALRIAGKEIVKLNLGKRDTGLLRKLRQVLKEATAISRIILPRVCQRLPQELDWLPTGTTPSHHFQAIEQATVIELITSPEIDCAWKHSTLDATQLCPSRLNTCSIFVFTAACLADSSRCANTNSP